MADDRPKKPSRTFPLRPHKSGSWVKVIDGKLKGFGGWKYDRNGVDALATYHAFMRSRGSGLAPAVAPSLATVADVINPYLNRQFDRAANGEISQVQYKGCLQILTEFVAEVSRNTRASDLRPATFGAYRSSLVGRKLAPSTIRRHLAIIRAAFRWAAETEIIDPVRFGPDFVAPPTGVRPRRLYTPDEVGRLIKAAKVPTRCYIRLGIECGFGATDIAVLRWEFVDLEAGAIDQTRNKTGSARRCFLSAALVEDLKAWRKRRTKRKWSTAYPELVFITKRGLPVARTEAGATAKDLPSQHDAVAKAFNKTMKRAGVKSGRGFYSLRRTHRTWSDELLDPVASDVVMGHRPKGMGANYVQQVGDERLRKINQHVVGKIIP